MNCAPSRGEYVPHCLYRGTGSGRSPEFVSNIIICTTRDLTYNIISTNRTPRVFRSMKNPRTSVNNALYAGCNMCCAIYSAAAAAVKPDQWHICIVCLWFNTLVAVSRLEVINESLEGKKTRVRTAKTVQVTICS